MTLNPHQRMQEAKYAVPYHYLASEKTVGGVLYLSYLRRARELLMAKNPVRAIDCGCGDGRFVAFVREADAAFPIEGTDYSEAALTFARAFNPGATFTVGNLLEKLPFGDSTFDALTMIEVVEHFEPHKLGGVLRELRRVLKPGGVFILTTPTILEKKVSKAHFQHFTEESMRKYLEDAGFRMVLIEGNYRASAMQALFQGLIENRFWAVRWKPLLSLYAKTFKKHWARCPVGKGRRMIVVAEAA